jgi:hypothetical protein
VRSSGSSWLSSRARWRTRASPTRSPRTPTSARASRSPRPTPSSSKHSSAFRFALPGATARPTSHGRSARVRTPGETSARSCSPTRTRASAGRAPTSFARKSLPTSARVTSATPPAKHSCKEHATLRGAIGGRTPDTDDESVIYRAACAIAKLREARAVLEDLVEYAQPLHVMRFDVEKLAGKG